MDAHAVSPRFVLQQLDQLKVELIDLAFDLERRGQVDAADVAVAVSGRVGELHATLACAQAVSPE